MSSKVVRSIERDAPGSKQVRDQHEQRLPGSAWMRSRLERKGHCDLTRQKRSGYFLPRENVSMPMGSGNSVRKPAQRQLRVFAFDPGVRAQLDTLSISELKLNLLWEDDLQPGPVGEYLEVVDYDPASGAFYEPINLDHRYVLAQDGLSPSEGGPQFHQQMVYAVAMNTIDHFERALGRVACWGSRIVRDEQGRFKEEQYVPRLRIYPHALREANAYYSPTKKALLFGYFPSRGQGPGQHPGGTVFTCLSYDIIAHETTHALLDGIHPSFNEPTNPDVHALHEGFADVVALLQRFAHPEILVHQIAKTRGNLEEQSLLGELAQQVGRELGMRRALRSAIGEYVTDASGAVRWQALKPDPKRLAAATEPHARGAILLAAVFSAFIAIYKMRSADLLRIATGGSGVLQEGAIHPDLVRRLAREAAEAANAVLTMCIRGLDYCPPVDVDFGSYLRGVITADAEVWPQETYPYRVAFIEAFRQWGIYPEGVRGMAESDLRYPAPEDPTEQLVDTRKPYAQDRTKDLFKDLELEWDLTTDRRRVWQTMSRNAEVIHRWLHSPAMRPQLPAFGLTLDARKKQSVYTRDGVPTIEVHAVRLARRRGFRDTLVTDLVVELRQRRRGYFSEQVQKDVDSGKLDHRRQKRDFRFRRGCTLVIDPVREQVRYAISTRKDVTDDDELGRVRQFLTGQSGLVGNPFYGHGCGADMDDEHFAALHRWEAVTPEF